ncbi:MAG: hypothetical protein MJ252_25760 [archaeon]|nr:hypothetical protein [archaeon]
MEGNSYGANMDSVALRKTNFRLGDYINPYTTTANEQSKAILLQGPNPAILDKATKDDLRRCHFKLGNNPMNFVSDYKAEYTDKSAENRKDNVDFKDIERRLRQTSYNLGNDKPDYVSDYKDRFKTPDLSKGQAVGPQSISTADLQKSHYNFGTSGAPWETTNMAAYVPKQIETKPFDLQLTKTNFKLGDDLPTLTSVHQDTYIKHPICVSNLNKELAKDLRSKK